MITEIDIEKITPHPKNPRKNIGDLEELTKSIRTFGVLQNLTVVPEWDGHMKVARSIIDSGEVDAIYMLRGWDKSPGASRERFWANGKGIRVIYQDAKDDKRYGRRYVNAGYKVQHESTD